MWYYVFKIFILTINLRKVTPKTKHLRVENNQDLFFKPANSYEFSYEESLPKGFEDTSPRDSEKPSPNRSEENLPRNSKESLPRSSEKNLPRNSKESLPRRSEKNLPRNSGEFSPRSSEKNLPRNSEEFSPRSSEQVLIVCNRFCECSRRQVEETVRKSVGVADNLEITCENIRRVKELNNELVTEELEGASLKVSDATISKINGNNELENSGESINSETENSEESINFEEGIRKGLRGIKKLELVEFPLLKTLDPLLFQNIFPNLQYIFIGECLVGKLTLPSMPRVTTFLLKSYGIHEIFCNSDDEKGCFHPLKMDRVEIHSYNAARSTLHDSSRKFKYFCVDVPLFPKEVTSFKVQTDQRLRMIFPQLMSEFVLEIEDIVRPVDLKEITVTERFTFGYKDHNKPGGTQQYNQGENLPFDVGTFLKKSAPHKMLSDIYNNPSLRNHLILKSFPSKLLPIIVPCDSFLCPPDNNPLEEVYTGDICAEENEILEQKNPSIDDLEKASTGTIWYRSFMVDLSKLIDDIGSKTSNLTVIVNAYYVYVSQPKKIDFKLKVYYTVLKTINDYNSRSNAQNRSPSTNLKAVIYRNWYEGETPPVEGIAFQDLPAFANTLSRASKVDALYMMAYAKCTLSMIAAYREKSYFTDLYQSKQWEMYLQFPQVVDEYVADDPLDATRARAIHSLVTGYISKLVEEDRAVSRVPYLSMNLQGENTEILLQIARDFQSQQNQFVLESQLETIEEQELENLKKILNGQDDAQINAFEISLQKANSLGEISRRKRDDIQIELDKVSEALRKMDSVSLDAQREVTTATEAFEAGAKRRQIEAYVEVALAVTSTLISIFSGGFDPNKMANAAMKAQRLAQKLTQLSKVMQMIGSLMRKLKEIKTILGRVKGFVTSRVAKLVSNLQKLKDVKVGTYVATLRQRARNAFDRLATPISDDANKKKKDASKLIGKRASRLRDIAEGVLAVSLAKKAYDAGFDPMPGFNPSEHMKAIEEGKSLDVSDVVQWDITRDQVEALLDASLSAEVPETTSYKAALFKFTTVGKAITQLQIDEAKLGNDYATADFAYLKYIEDYTTIETKLTEIRNASERRREDQTKTLGDLQKEYINTYSKRETTLFWELFLTKLELVSNNVEFCNAYAYFHLETCPPDLQFNVLDSLEKITQVQTKLLIYSKRELQSLYPPPQTFHSISMIFQNEDHCQCVEDLFTGIQNANDTLDESNEGLAGCFPGKSRQFTQQDLRDVIEKFLMCKMKDIDTFIKEKMFSWSVAINSKLPFENYERVRVDEIRVYLHGAKTDSGKITIDISNAGVSQDRFKGRIYKFYGEPWLREFSYISESSRKDDFFIAYDILCSISVATPAATKWEGHMEEGQKIF